MEIGMGQNDSQLQALPPGRWTLDSSTVVTVTAKKLAVITVDATLAVTSGSVTVGDDGAVSSISATVDAGSYDSGNDKRDEHVRSDDFLDAETHPEISFASGSATPVNSGFRIDGAITVKGSAYPMNLHVEGVRVDGDRATFTASGHVDRTAVGVAKMPALIISKSIEIVIAAVAHHRT